MKDRSRLLSSVIVSLLAGFIYYQFGEDIQSKIRSFKAVISSIDSEFYGPEYHRSFHSGINKSDEISNVKKAKFFIRKKNTIELKKNGVSISEEKLLSGIVSIKQANLRKAIPDKNIDFSTELNNLINSRSDIKDNKEYKINWKIGKNKEVAENRTTRSEVIMIIKGLDKSGIISEFNPETGFGFEFNYIFENEYGGGNNQNQDIKTTVREKNCVNENCCKKEKINLKTEKKIKILLPKIIFEEEEIDSKSEAPELNIQDNSCEEDTM
ncbi:MAG: hypothetical protein ABIY50_07900 [Ignavibacteria bacterium]